MRKLSILVILILGLSPAWGENPGERVSNPIPSTEYILQTGDELELHVLALPEEEKKYVVRVDGSFFHPAIGDVRAAGRTIDDIRAEVAKRLARELRNPTFRLGLTSYAEDEVAVLGEVKQQGQFKVRKGATVLELLAQAGGLSETADRDIGTLVRGDQQFEVSLKPSSDERSMALKPGDILYVNTGLRISVAGEVQEPGIYAVSRMSPDPLGDAVKLAGGAKANAAIKRVKLLRPEFETPKILSLKAEGLPEKLQDGDTIVLPSRAAMVLGGVSEQGAIPLEGEETLFEVVSAAKLVREAKLDKIVVVRAKNVQSGSTEREVYNLKDLLKAKTNEEDTDHIEPVRIYDGDLVYVPVKGKKNNFLQGNAMIQLLFMARSFLF